MLASWFVPYWEETVNIEPCLHCANVNDQIFNTQLFCPLDKASNKNGIVGKKPYFQYVMKEVGFNVVTKTTVTSSTIRQ